MQDDNFTYTPAVNGEVKHYEGPVVDLQVDGAESFVTPSGVAHNCRAWGVVDHPLMRCGHGCRVTPKPLTHAEAQAKFRLLHRIAKEAGLDEIVALHPIAWPANEADLRDALAKATEAAIRKGVTP